MTTKQRNRVLTFAEAIMQNQKTARVWVELRYNIPICAYFLVRHKQNVPSDSVQSWYWQLRRRRRGLRHKVAVLGKRADTRRNQTRAVE